MSECAKNLSQAPLNAAFASEHSKILERKIMKFAKTIENLEAWRADLRPVKLDEILSVGAEKTAFLSIDLINGFCKQGALASPRCASIAAGTAEIFKAAYERGARNLLLIQDCHDAQSAEFSAFPPHALGGTDEAEAVSELKSLKFYDELKIIRKNSLSVGCAPEFTKFLAQNPQINTFALFGDCTDLCVYNAASYLALSANEANVARRVIVPANLVQTYDAPWHEGDFYQLVFLNHMSQAFNAQIVSEILV